MFSELTWRKMRLTMSVTGFPDKKNKAVSDQHSADSLSGGTIEVCTFWEIINRRMQILVLHTKAK
jgi:hypothetical protein